MSNKDIIRFYKEDGSIVFESSEDTTILDYMMAITKLKQVLFESFEDIDVNNVKEYDLTNDDDKTLFLIQIIKTIEEDNLWGQDEFEEELKH